MAYCVQQIHRRSNHSGFSMLETIVALSVMSISLLAIFGAMRASANAAYHSRMQTKAILLAESKMVEAKLTRQSTYGITKGQHDRFRWEVSIEPTTIESLGAVTARIKWMEQEREQAYELISFIQMKSFQQTTP